MYETLDASSSICVCIRNFGRITEIDDGLCGTKNTRATTCERGKHVPKLFFIFFFFFFHIVARTISLKHSKLQSFFCSDIFPLSRRLNEAREKKNCNKTIATIATTTATTKSQTTAAIFLLLNCERLRCSTVGVIFAFQV